MPNNLMSVISNPKSSGKKLDRLFTIGEDTIQNSQRIYANQKPMGWHLTVENDKVCVRLLKEKYFKRTFPSGHLKPALTLYTLRKGFARPSLYLKSSCYLLVQGEQSEFGKEPIDPILWIHSNLSLVRTYY